jgi:tryptophan synthase alpha chain
MSRIDTIFSDGKKKLMPFVVAGDPSLDSTESILRTLDAGGADIIEIGIPFSDPIADGPVIAAAMHRALERRATPAHAIGMVSRVREDIDAGLIAMVSHSLVRKSGATTFIDRLAGAGFDGIIIPDIDDTEAELLSKYCSSRDFSFTMLIAPTTPIERVKKLALLSSGFLYVLARTGLTGEQKELPDLESRVQEIRSVTDLPLAIGFGISNAKHVSSVLQYADAAIVGSALVRQLKDSTNPAESAANFIQEISQ